MKKLFTDQTANLADKANAFTSDGSGVLTVHAFGTFDTSQLDVYMSLNGIADGILLTDLSFTAAGLITLTVADEVTIWAELSSVGAGTEVSLWISGMGDD